MKIALIVAALLFFVLVNFLAFRKQLLKEVERPIELPNARPTDPKMDIPVVVLSSTSCTVADETIEITNLRERLGAAKAAGKTSVSIKAAHGVSSEALLHVYNVVRQSGIDRISITPDQS